MSIQTPDILALIEAQPGISTSELAERLGATYTKMGSRVSKLMAQGYIRKISSNPSRWSVTEKITPIRKSKDPVRLEVEYCGERMCLSEATRMTGVNYQTVRSRIKLGWAVEDALIVPAGKKRSE